MAPRTSILSLRTLLSLLLSLVHLTSSATVSIATFTPYQSLRSCARCCYWECNARGNFILAFDQLSCDNNPIDSCFCREDLVPVATSYLSKCIYTACSSNLNDVNSGVFAYTEYCKHTGEVGIPTTGATEQAATAGAYTITKYITATVTVTSGANRLASTPPVPRLGFEILGSLVVAVAVALGSVAYVFRLDR